MEIKTDEVNRILENIDDEMKRENVPILGRSFRGTLKLCSLYGILYSFPYHPLINYSHNWFEMRYGKKLTFGAYPSIRDSIIVIRNDFYKLRLPKVYGKVKLNPLEYIEDLTPNYAHSLSKDEINEIVESFKFILSAIDKIDCNIVRELEFVKEGIGDIQTAISQLFYQSPQYGSSKWSSLQAVEKFLKAYIKSKEPSTDIKKLGHLILNLAKKARSLGLLDILDKDLEQIKCQAAVRYGEISVERMEAVEAHYASLRVCSQTATQLGI